MGPLVKPALADCWRNTYPAEPQNVERPGNNSYFRLARQPPGPPIGSEGHRGHVFELGLYFQRSLNSAIGRVQRGFPAFVSLARKFAALLVSARMR